MDTNFETWSKEHRITLREMHIDPVRSSPDRIRGMMNYFRTPDASIGGVSRHFDVSRPLARKIRDYTIDGALDWAMGGEPKRAQVFDAEWQGFVMAHPVEFSQGVEAYKQELGRQIQMTEICLGTRFTYMPPKVPYSSAHRPFVESVFKRNRGLMVLRREFESALEEGEVVIAQELGERLGSELVDLTAI